MTLEPDRATLERWLAEVSTAALDHLDQLGTAPAVGPTGAAGQQATRAASLPIPEVPAPGGAKGLALHIVAAAEASLGTAGPGYLAYIPGGGIPTAGLAGLLADWLNRYTGLSAAAPALCRLEADTLAWLAAEFGLSPQARGIFTSGGSLANLSAVVTARHNKLGDDGDYRDAIVYTSSQAHHSVTRSVRLAGIPAKNVRQVATDARFRLRPDALLDAVAGDKRDGRRPFLLVSAAGTTNTGAVDPLPVLADICEEAGLWHHVDAAYGGPFVLCPEGRARLRGIERADSITFDPHKGLFLPYGTGALLVADGRLLRDAHHADAEYLQDFERLDRSAEPPSPTDYGPELSRPFRGLKLWLPLQLHGAAAFREALTEKLELARWLCDGLADRIGEGLPLEIVDEPQLSVVTFRCKRALGEPAEAWNARTAALCESINARGRVFLSSTKLPWGDETILTLRACVLSFRTHLAQIEAALDDIANSAMR